MKNRCFSWACFLAAACLVSSVCARGDVLVTKSGKRWVGTVTKEAEGYRIRLPSGVSMVLPASMVKEVITPVEKKGQFAKMTATADLLSDAKVAELVAFADKWSLVGEKSDLLRRAHTLRLARAKANATALRKLAGWLDTYGLKKDSAACRLQASTLDYVTKRKAAKNDPVALAKLAVWCSKNALTAEAAACEKLAVKLAPDSKEVRKILGGAAGWKAAVSWARNYGRYSHDLLAYTHTVSTVDLGKTTQTKSLAIIRLKLTSPDLKTKPPGSWYSKETEILPREYFTHLRRYPGATRSRLALLDGSQFTLTLPTGQTLTPVSVFLDSSEEMWSWGTDVVKGEKREISLSGGARPKTLMSWTRKRGVYYALLKPKVQIEATVLFEISPDVSRGKLSLAGNHVSDVTLVKGPIPKPKL